MTIFSKIISGEIPSYKIAEDENFFAFLDISPLAKGHTLVVPKIEEEYIFNLDDRMLGDLMIFSKKVAKAIEKAVPCLRIGVAVVGLEVPHTHVHLVPIHKVSDLSFAKEKLKLEAEEMKTIADAIREKF